VLDKMREFMSLTRCTLLCAGALVVLACGGAAVPQERLTSVQASIKAAEAGGAPSVPKAALHLKQAKDQLEQAKTLIEDDENERADFVLQRAEADADLALAMAQEESAKKEAQEVIEQVAELRKKLKEKAQ
jgi:hypothetical protein